MVHAREMEAVFEAAARLQVRVPDAVLVSGTAPAHHAGHRVSLDDDHVVADLRDRFVEILAALEDTEGWVTARVQRPVLILGRLDGVETGIRNLIRRRPLEVEDVAVAQRTLRVPTLPEIARIKAWLCLVRNATRDYLDFAALADRLGERDAAAVVASMDDYYADQAGAGGRRVSIHPGRQAACRAASGRPGRRRLGLLPKARPSVAELADGERRLPQGRRDGARPTRGGLAVIHRHLQISSVEPGCIGGRARQRNCAGQH